MIKRRMIPVPAILNNITLHFYICTWVLWSIHKESRLWTIIYEKCHLNISKFTFMFFPGNNIKPSRDPMLITVRSVTNAVNKWIAKSINGKLKWYLTDICRFAQKWRRLCLFNGGWIIFTHLFDTSLQIFHSGWNTQ